MSLEINLGRTLNFSEQQLKEVTNVAIKEIIAENHIRVVHLFDKKFSYGGVTVAYQPEKFKSSNGFPLGIFAKVSVAYCNDSDRYCRKTGQSIAVNRLINGEFILLPIYATRQPVNTLKQMFECLYYY
jgi:hypothetical protein